MARPKKLREKDDPANSFNNLELARSAGRKGGIAKSKSKQAYFPFKDPEKAREAQKRSVETRKRNKDLSNSIAEGIVSS